MRFIDSDVVPVLLFGPIGSMSSLAGNKCRTDGFSVFSFLEGARHCCHHADRWNHHFDCTSLRGGGPGSCKVEVAHFVH